MRLIILAIFVIFAYNAHAFKIPTDSPDGFYSVPLSSNGTALEKPTRFYPHKEKKTNHKGRLALTSRAFPSASIGCNNYNMNGNDATFSQLTFVGQCNGYWVNPGFFKGYAHYNKFGSAVTYMCNYGGWNPCHFGELVEAMGAVNTVCGNARAGWLHINEWKKAYGRSNTGTEICGSTWV